MKTMKNKYYKTIITFNVLSQDPIPDDMTLATAEQAAEELLKQGSSPSFFGLEGWDY